MSRVSHPSPIARAAVLLLVLAAIRPALALECPVPQPGGPDVLRESASQIAALSELLASGDLDNRVPTLVDDLRRRHPAARPSEIVNYLVAAYCPIVAARAGLDEAAKRARVERFASQVATLTEQH